MVCALIQPDLVAYEFGLVDDETRDSIEAHLQACPTCLSTYLQLRRHLTRAAHSSDRPSEAVRLRLRAEVESTFRPTAVRRLLAWARRPIPFYQGLATAAAAACLVLVVRDVAPHRATGSAAAVHAEQSERRVDSSRTNPENLTLY